MVRKLIRARIEVVLLLCRGIETERLTLAQLGAATFIGAGLVARECVVVKRFGQRIDGCSCAGMGAKANSADSRAVSAI